MKYVGMITAVVASLLFSVAPAGAAVIQEISVDSIDTSYDASTGVILFEQAGVMVVREWSDGTQDFITGARFKMTTTLAVDMSDPTGPDKRAAGLFTGGSITLDDGGGTTYLYADISEFYVEEAIVLPGCVLAGRAVFTIPTGSAGGIWQPNIAWTQGETFALTWVSSVELDSFLSQDFTSIRDESDLTIIPEPATMALLALGAPAALARRRKRQIRRSGK